MTELRFISYIKKLNLGDWNTKVTSKWTVKEVVAHIAGWVELDVKSLEGIGKIEILPWRKKGFDVDKYNTKTVSKYSKISPTKLIEVLEKILDMRSNLVKNVGKKNIRKDKELFHYLFGGGNAKHILHHYKQIKKVLKI